MKLFLLLLLYPAVLISLKTEKLDLYSEFNVKKRNLFVNILINKFITYIRHIVTYGSTILHIPPLDPLEIDDFHIIIPTGVFNLDLLLKNISVTGIGGFIMHRNNLHLCNLTFEIDISIPRIVISAETMQLREADADLTPVVPIYSKYKAGFEMDNFRYQATMVLKQSDDEKSVLIDRIQDSVFDIPSCKIDGLITAENLSEFSDIQETLIEYLNGYKEAIAQIISNAIMTFGNPLLNMLNTWRYISVLL